jgi:hypothetical protein
MSYTLFSNDERVARKPHNCIWCGQKINPGEKYHDERSVYDGQIQRHRWHPECLDASHKYFRESHEDEFTPWENDRPILSNSNSENTKK